MDIVRSHPQLVEAQTGHDTPPTPCQTTEFFAASRPRGTCEQPPRPVLDPDPTRTVWRGGVGLPALFLSLTGEQPA